MAETTGKNDLSVWVLTDGKIGDDVQCLAIANALTRAFSHKIIEPRWLWAAMAPWGPIDPRDAPSAPGSVLSGDCPDVVIASGRRAIPYARALRRLGAKIILLKDPRVSRRYADFLWAPEHDRVAGANVYETLTSPHEVTAKIAMARASKSGRIRNLATPLLGVVLGGPSGGANYSKEVAIDFAKRINEARQDFGAVAITPSRRTPAEFLGVLRGLIQAENVFIWDGKGDNPYVEILAHSNALIVAGDSHNMMSEAVATGVGVYAWRPPGLTGKLTRFLDRLVERGLVRDFSARARPFPTEPVDATPDIVEEIRARLKI